MVLPNLRSYESPTSSAAVRSPQELMLAAFVLFFSALKAAGINMAEQSSPLTELPAGVSGYVGWANRLLFAASYLWTTLASLSVLKARDR